MQRRDRHFFFGLCYLLSAHQYIQNASGFIIGTFRTQCDAGQPVDKINYILIHHYPRQELPPPSGRQGLPSYKPIKRLGCGHHYQPLGRLVSGAT